MCALGQHRAGGAAVPAAPAGVSVNKGLGTPWSERRAARSACVREQTEVLPVGQWHVPTFHRVIK